MVKYGAMLTESIALIGKNGMLGSDLLTVLQKAGYTVIPFGSKEIDITNEHQIESRLSQYPDITHVINCAAYTKVDDCETQYDLAYQVNAIGPKNLAQYCKKNKLILLHFSTDYVFNGTKKSPYTEDDPTDPVNAYGKSKLEGEKWIQSILPHHYIFRVQWLYGKNGYHFISAILKLIETTKPLTIVNDQWGSPSSTKDLSHYIAQFLKFPYPYGIYHLHNAGFTTWFDYTQLICKTAKKDCTIIPIPSSQFKRPANRPLNSKLSTSKLKELGIELPKSWDQAVIEYLNEDMKRNPSK